jgi:TfoX/Sxy family transcriptional regulator of competence genes
MSEASEELADRIRALIGHKPGITEKRMFGGYGFMLNGNMVCGAMSSGSMLMRVGPENHEAAKRRPGAHAMHQGGREMVGFIEVTDEGLEDDEAIRDWIAYSWKVVAAMPPKAEKPKPTKAKTATKKAPAAKKATPARKKVAARNPA